MASPSNLSKNKVLSQELKYYTSLLAQHEKNKTYNGLNLLDSCGRKISQKDFNINSKISSHSFNTKSSYWNFKGSKHAYSCIRSSKKMPETLSRNMLQNTLNKQLNSQEDKSINSSFKMLPHSKNCKTFTLNTCNKQSNFSQKTQNITPKKCDYKTSKCVQKSVQAKKESKKLIGDIMAITQELKLKSKNLGPFCGQKYPVERYSSISNIKSIKKPIKKIGESINSISDYSSRTTEKDLILCGPQNKFQIQPGHVADCLKITSCKNNGIKTPYANVQTKLNRIEKSLENSSNGTNKKLLNHLTQKTNTIFGVKTCHSREVNIKNCDKPVKSLLNLKSESKKMKKLNSKFLAIANRSTIKPYETFVFNHRLCNSSSLLKKANQLSKSPDKLNSKYKFVNKALTSERILTEKIAVTNNDKNLKLFNLRKRNLSSYKLTNIGIKKTASNSRMSFNRLTLKNSPSICAETQRNKFGRQKHTYNYFIKKQNICRSYFPKQVLQNKAIEIQSASDVDSDLLLELAAENKLKQVSQRHFFKSKHRIINNHSLQKRTAKMIKMKYFNPIRKNTEWKNVESKTFKGFSKVTVDELNIQNKTFTRINKRSARFNKNVSHKFQTSRACNKIVTLKGEQFIVGSKGKSLKKLKQISKCKKKTKRASYSRSLSEAMFPEKITSPASKIMANRVLSLSINRMLSASEKKKTNKMNTYCMFYNRFGRCNKGVQCQYVHDPSKIAVCTRFLRGTCKNNKCPFSHEVNPGKMAICSFFLQDICTNLHCPYRHEKLSPDSKLCKDFVQGYCSKGKECKKAHVLICPKYIQGICEKGKLCAFPHPAARDKTIISKESTEKTVDHLSETVKRYFQSNHDGNVVRGLVIPRRKTLPEQPSFISLSLEKSS